MQLAHSVRSSSMSRKLIDRAFMQAIQCMVRRRTLMCRPMDKSRVLSFRLSRTPAHRLLANGDDEHAVLVLGLDVLGVGVLGQAAPTAHALQTHATAQRASNSPVRRVKPAAEAWHVAFLSRAQGAGSCSGTPAWRAEAPGHGQGAQFACCACRGALLLRHAAHPGVAHRRVRLMKPLGRSPARPAALPGQQGAFALCACGRAEPVSKHMLSAHAVSAPGAQEQPRSPRMYLASGSSFSGSCRSTLSPIVSVSSSCTCTCALTTHMCCASTAAQGACNKLHADGQADAPVSRRGAKARQDYLEA